MSPTRRLILPALSLVLSAATAVTWARSYHAGDVVSINLPQFGDPLADDTLNVVTGRGGVRVSFVRWAAWELGTRKPTRAALHPSRVVHQPLRPPFYPYELNQTLFKAAGFELSVARETPTPTSVGSGIVYELNVVVPLPVVSILSAILPVRWYRRYRRQRRSARGFVPLTAEVRSAGGSDASGDAGAVRL